MFKRILVLMLLTVPATAAQITVNDGIIRLSGRIMEGDKQSFANIVFSNKVTAVLLNSIGGDAGEAIEIGTLIRMRALMTGVPKDCVCASACALIWLAGSHRLATPESHIGFHAVYSINQQGVKEVSSDGNAAVGAYLYSLGLSQAAIIRFMSPPPTDVYWLKADEARQLGIDIEIIPTSQPPQQAQPSSTPSVHGVRSDVGMAEGFVERYLHLFSAGSDPGAAVAQLAPFYGEQVLYYGQVRNKREIMAEYADLVRRWPERNYSAKQIFVNCNTNDKCMVNASIEWGNSSQPRNARSTGSSTLYLVLSSQGDGNFTIDVINGEVKSRVVSKLTEAAQRPAQPCLFGVLCLNDGN